MKADRMFYLKVVPVVCLLIVSASCTPGSKRASPESASETAAKAVVVNDNAASKDDSFAWSEDFSSVQAAAREKQLPVLAFFTGSDWCGWCKKLDKEVLSQSEFQDYAAKHYVLFKADFPRSRKLDDLVASQNKELANRFGVRGFPTIIIMDADGKVLATTGYRQGGARQYVQHLEEITP